jgi:hypothetical protein
VFFEYLFKSLSIITKVCDKDQFLFIFLGFPLNKIWCLWLNLTELMCGKTCLCLYPLCKSLFVNHILELSPIGVRSQVPVDFAFAYGVNCGWGVV